MRGLRRAVALVRSPVTRAVATSSTPATTTSVPTSNKLRSLWDVTLGGYLSQGLGLDPLLSATYERHGRARVHGVDLLQAKLTVLVDPDDWMTVLRSEWSNPSGAGEFAWPFTEVYREMGYSNDHPDPDKRPTFGIAHGETWRVGRMLYQPLVFRAEAVSSYVPRLEEVARTIPEFVRKQPNGRPVLEDLANRVAFEMVASVLLGQRMGLLDGSVRPDVQEFVDTAAGTFALTPDLQFMPRDRAVKSDKYREFSKRWQKLMELGAELSKRAEESNVESVVSKVRNSDKAKRPSYAQVSNDLAGLLSAGVDTVRWFRMWPQVPTTE